MRFGSPLRTSVLALAMVAMQATTNVAPSPPIQASIHTAWEAPPLLLEILEAVAVENKTAYYPLMRQLTEPSFLDTVSSQKDLYEKSMGLIQDQEFVSHQALSTLKLSLAMHITAPWIQAHYHLYNSTIVPDRSSRSGFNPDCGVWVDWYDHQICTISELEAIVAGGLDQHTETLKAKPTTISLDHVLSSEKESSLFTILYADVLDPDFAKFRHYLDMLSKDHGLEYSIRYRPPVKYAQGSPLTLAGYGVELALKSTDYIVIDDRDLGHSEDGDSSGQTAFRNDAGQGLFGDETPSVEPVSQQDLSDMDLAAAQFILQSDNPMRTLVAVSQDFPKYQRKISKLPVNSTLRSTVEENSMDTRDDRAKVWLNNQPVPHHKMNPFNLIRLMRRERESLASLATLGISTKKAIDLLTDIGSADGSESGSEELTGVFDVRDKSEGKNLVVWINDLESDQRYKSWNSNINEILRPIYRGQFHQVRRNVINALFVFDLSSPKAMEVISLEVANYVQRMIPFRFGILPLIKSDDGEDAKMAMLWRHTVSRYGIKGGLEFLKQTLINHFQGGQDIINASRTSFASAMRLPKLKTAETPELTYEEVIAPGSSYRVWLKDAKAMGDHIGITGQSLFINGKHFPWNEDHAQTLMMETPRQTEFLAGKLRKGELPDDVNVYEYLLTLPSVYERRNPYIFVSDESPLKVVNLAQEQERPFVDTLSFISNGNGAAQTTTVLIIADFDSERGLVMAREALLSIDDKQNETRVAFIQNGKSTKESSPTLGNFVRQSSVDGKALPIGFWRALLQGVTEKEPFLESFKKASSQHPEIAMVGMEGSMGLEEQSDRARRSFLSDTVNAKEGEIYFIVNGRVIGPVQDSFTATDFKLLINYEKNMRVNKVKNLLKNAQIEQTASNIMKVSSIVIGATQQIDQSLYDINEAIITRDRLFEDLNSEHTGFTVNPTVHADKDDVLFHFTAILDPVNELTQRWAPILETLSQMNNVNVKIILKPSLQLSEVPIKRFYRYVAEAELSFDANGDIVPPNAYFANLPETTLLTLGMDVNPAWVVTSKVCIHDLDNLKLSSLTGSSISTGVQAKFELQHILIEGYARDMSQKMPPKGAQFILGTKAEPHVADTLVMANMGYFQLKANPGVWEMVLRPGRTHEVFSIESIGSEGWVPGGVQNDKRDVIIANFEGLTLYPRLVRNPGMERANVQDEAAQESGGLWGSIKSTASSLKSLTSTGTTAPAKKKADINIFSVASGHLYERFLSIMMLSVIKNTESRVKFWFIENFLSPSFKDFIPHMAEKYDFDYELVTYNWPHWLRAQTEKQRVIWAYKILFLDVLFPLDLDKVIFVDADQIVRADMKELVDMDLHGAPYGYTPMCQDRKEMEGFRFWNQGYWKSHLAGKPYHISALYVIDLVRFRQMQAGDRLRNHYQQLSRDPDSLANLDQDLPNNMQNDVPIFSLPQEWLWCETWCGDDGLAKAKTIDLCNNPLTKEPKLDRARRQIKEWESLDNEATEFAKQVNAEFKVARQKQDAGSVENPKVHVTHEQEQGQGQQRKPREAKDVHATKDEL